MHFLCQFRQALDAPAVMTDLMDEAGLGERLEAIKVRLLGHYVAVAPSAGGGCGCIIDGEGVGDGVGGDGDGDGYGSGEEGEGGKGLMLSNPERCLEIALGREPRWVQWEWVCQCLDC